MYHLKKADFAEATIPKFLQVELQSCKFQRSKRKKVRVRFAFSCTQMKDINNVWVLFECIV